MRVVMATADVNNHRLVGTGLGPCGFGLLLPGPLKPEAALESAVTDCRYRARRRSASISLHQPLSASISLHQPPSASISLHQPLSASISLHQPLSASISLYQPPLASISLYQPLSASISLYHISLYHISLHQPLSASSSPAPALGCVCVWAYIHLRAERFPADTNLKAEAGGPPDCVTQFRANMLTWD